MHITHYLMQNNFSVNTSRFTIFMISFLQLWGNLMEEPFSTGYSFKEFTLILFPASGNWGLYWIKSKKRLIQTSSLTMWESPAVWVRLGGHNYVVSFPQHPRLLGITWKPPQKFYQMLERTLLHSFGTLWIHQSYWCQTTSTCIPNASLSNLETGIMLTWWSI